MITLGPDSMDHQSGGGCTRCLGEERRGLEERMGY